MTLRNNDTQSLQLWKKTVQRFSFIVNLVGNGALSSLALDLINIKITLRRGGVDRVLAHENLQILAQESMFFAGFEHALQKTALEISNTMKMLPLIVDLGGPVNLFADDELTVEVTSKTGWYGDFDASQSSIEVEAREAIGVESAIPFIKTKYISATHSRVQETLGDFVSSIMLLNTEANRTAASTDKVFESIIITSDKWNISDNRGRMIGRRATQFETVEAAQARKENFRYIPNVSLDNTQITLELNGSNVVATKNCLVIRHFLPTRETSQRYAITTQKHLERNTEKVASSI